MFNVSAEQEGSYVLMVASGPAGAAELCAAISFLTELLERKQCKRALLDMMGLDFVLDAPADAAVLQHLSERMPALARLAVVVPSSTSHGLVVAAARGKGVLAAEFDNHLDADAWITA